MATKLPPVDALLVGFGWTGAVLGQELTEAGLNVLALERGGWRDTTTDFATTFIQDELRYYYRYQLFQEPARETLTFRNAMSETALPMRASRFVPAGYRRWRRRHPLEWAKLAISANGLCGALSQQ